MKLNIEESSKYLKVSKDTLRRWEKRGYLVPLRTPSNRRIYDKDQLDSILKARSSPKPKFENQSKPKRRNTRKVLYISFFLFLVIDIVLLFLLKLS